MQKVNKKIMKLVTCKRQKGMALKGQGDRNKERMKDNLWNTAFYILFIFRMIVIFHIPKKRMKINKNRMDGIECNTSKTNETDYREGKGKF